MTEEKNILWSHQFIQYSQISKICYTGNTFSSSFDKKRCVSVEIQILKIKPILLFFT